MALLLAGAALLPISSLLYARYDNPLHASSRFLAFPAPTSSQGTLSLRIQARGIPRKENAKTRNRRMRRKFNGSPTKPRLSVFCSARQLYAMLVDDHNKKTLFYANSLQKSILEDPPCSTIVLVASNQRAFNVFYSTFHAGGPVSYNVHTKVFLTSLFCYRFYYSNLFGIRERMNLH